MIRWLSILIFAFIAGLTLTAFGQTFESSDFEDFVKETMDASNVPGLAVVLFDDTGLIYEKAFGIAGPDQTAVTLDTPFQIGSVSKSFAALGLGQLADEGHVDLDTAVIDYLPYFRLRGPNAGQGITLRHVLSHRSGISTLDGNRRQDDDYRGADALEIAVKGLAKAKPINPPGEQFEYSNANYMIVAAIIEDVTGESFETVMADRIFNPLSMGNSYVQIPERVAIKEAVGYRQWFGVPVAHPYIAGRSGMAAGGVTTSARDLATYVNAIAHNDPRIITPAITQDLFAPQGDGIDSKPGYGLGWMLVEIDGQKMVYHSGLNGGFAAQAAFFPGDKRGGVVVTNLSGSLQADVAGAVLRKGLGISPGPSKPSTGQRATIWGLAVTVLVLAFSFLLSTVRFTAYAKSEARVNVFRRVLPALGLLALAYGLAVIVPKINGITLSGIKVFYPDTWLCLTASALIAVIWGVTRLIYPSWRRKMS